MIHQQNLLTVEKRAWKEIRRNQPGRWAKVLKKAVPERYKELVRYARRG